MENIRYIRWSMKLERHSPFEVNRTVWIYKVPEIEKQWNIEILPGKRKRSLISSCSSPWCSSVSSAHQITLQKSSRVDVVRNTKKNTQISSLTVRQHDSYIYQHNLICNISKYQISSPPRNRKTKQHWLWGPARCSVIIDWPRCQETARQAIHSGRHKEAKLNNPAIKIAPAWDH